MYGFAIVKLIKGGNLNEFFAKWVHSDPAKAQYKLGFCLLINAKRRDIVKKKAFYYVITILIAMSLCACTPQSGDDPASGTESMIPTQVTFPTESTMPAPSTEDISNIISWELPEYALDDVGHYVLYEGGEMHIPYAFTYTGSELSQYGVALMIFLDGQLQPFRTNEDGTLQYVHTIYPEACSKETTVLLDLIFTPITGQNGDTMDLSIFCKQLADWEWGNESVGMNGYTSCITTRLKFAHTPVKAELPEIESRIKAWSCSYTDATLAEYESWTEDSWNKLSACMRIDGEGYGHQDDQSHQSYRYLYDVTSNAPMEVTLDMVNTSGVEYGVVIFVDNEPISTDLSDLIYVDNATGQRATISVTVDLSDFDGQSKVYAVIVPRNYLARFGYTSDLVVDVVDTVEFYLFEQSSWAEVVNE